MKVYNLCCQHAHAFEGWFSSEADYLQQQSSGILTCPMCHDATIQRMPSAPRLNLLGNKSQNAKTSVSENDVATSKASHAISSHNVDVNSQSSIAKLSSQELQAQLLAAASQMIAQTEDVGERFTDEVRAMHYGDANARNIRGKATAEERQSLIEEGIEVFALPELGHLGKTLQ